MKLYLSMRQNEAAEVCRKTPTLMVPLHLLSTCCSCIKFPPIFAFLNSMSKIFIAARVDSSLRPLCKGYLLHVPCSHWPDRNLIHLKSLILSRCDPSAITCLGGPNVLDSRTVRLPWALSPEPSGSATFPKIRVPLCPSLWWHIAFIMCFHSGLLCYTGIWCSNKLRLSPCFLPVDSDPTLKLQPFCLVPNIVVVY